MKLRSVLYLTTVYPTTSTIMRPLFFWIVSLTFFLPCPGALHPKVYCRPDQRWRPLYEFFESSCQNAKCLVQDQAQRALLQRNGPGYLDHRHNL
jgi:hypothetical protein